jgi:hypothetical protein
VEVYLGNQAIIVLVNYWLIKEEEKERKKERKVIFDNDYFVLLIINGLFVFVYWVDPEIWNCHCHVTEKNAK